jgi:hypothetical protein
MTPAREEVLARAKVMIGECKLAVLVACPACGATAVEDMPTDACVFF